MASSFLRTASILLFSLFFILTTALPQPQPQSKDLSPRLPPGGVEGPNCIHPLVTCSGVCCSVGSTCTAAGLCRPPPPPKLGVVSVEHYTDPTGHSGLIRVLGSGFSGTADVMVQAWGPGLITDLFLKENVPGPSWSFDTGIQDCLLDGSPTAATDGDITYVFADDNAMTQYYNYQTPTKNVTVRATKDGSPCAKLRRIVEVLPAGITV
ncbi:hypothetical protein K432DRAFT_380742 [Lepidopterella palustris CBS 459.81]|uniref:Uncharacterized protein n=1 Tax=Lepidopterella palustris CBS 459.81 TaxID=1314670 RepID=A0A8E2EE37_9PEZI|nr:hypothetical protein K432DRAFT_380742 [Lepidopterella palustris CBS 459.81]